jgi:hypothetical protein
LSLTISSLLLNPIFDSLDPKQWSFRAPQFKGSLESKGVFFNYFFLNVL